MGISERKRNYDAEYKKNNIKRVPLDMQISEFEKIKMAATFAGESINTYIKEAIRRRMENEGQP